MAAPEREKLAINQATTMKQWSLREAVEGYAAKDIRGISVWRDKLAECGVEVAAELLRDNGMTVTGYAGVECFRRTMTRGDKPRMTTTAAPLTKPPPSARSVWSWFAADCRTDRKT